MKAVIFDMDGVIVDSEECHLHSWQRIFERFSLPFGKKDFKESFGKTTSPKEFVNLFYRNA
jgi:beta-phosphoglucomutase-like phosphatase (HAD superfamily)